MYKLCFDTLSHLQYFNEKLGIKIKKKFQIYFTLTHVWIQTFEVPFMVWCHQRNRVKAERLRDRKVRSSGIMWGKLGLIASHNLAFTTSSLINFCEFGLQKLVKINSAKINLSERYVDRKSKPEGDFLFPDYWWPLL